MPVNTLIDLLFNVWSNRIAVKNEKSQKEKKKEVIKELQETVEKSEQNLKSNLSDYQFIGEDLPKLENKENRRVISGSISFDYQIISDNSGNLEFQVARKDSGTHWKWNFTGLEENDANLASYKFIKTIKRAKFFERLIYNLSWACYRGEDSDEKRQENKSKQIIKNVTDIFLDIILPKAFKYKKVNKYIGVIEYEKEKYKLEKDFIKEKELFLKEIYLAFKDWNIKNKRSKITQKEIAFVVFEKYAGREKEMTSRLKDYRLDFKKLYSFYKGRNMDDFVNWFL